MFRALIFTLSGGTVYRVLCLLAAQNIPIAVYTVPADDEQISDRNI
jgi:hypothetical protein